MTAVSNAVLETEIFCHRYLNINNFRDIGLWLVLLNIYAIISRSSNMF